MKSNYKPTTAIRRLACLAVAILASISAFGQTASFTISDNTLFLCGGTTAQVQFTNTSSNVPNGATYFWNFGNGTPGSNLTNPSQVYNAPGPFTVTLQMLLNGNVISTATQNLTVQTPFAAFTPVASTGCEKQTLFQFTNQPVVGDSFIWNFGDGVTQANINNPTHIYNSPNPSYNVSLLVYVDGFTNACASAYTTVNVLPVPNAVANASATVLCDPNESVNFTNTSVNAISHQWSFGDGQSSTLANPSHVYGALGSYDVEYVATGTGGCKDTFNLTIDIVTGILPQITATVDSGCSPLSVTFTCPNVNNAQQYVWDFGDGSTPATTAQPQVSYTYVNGTPATQSFNVSLTTIYGNGSSCNSSVTMPNFVTVYPQPVVSFVVQTPSACVLSTVSFSTNTPNAASYLWNFGNGQSSTLQNPTTTYNTSGPYDISLTVTNTLGCSNTSTITNAVTINSIVADFNAINTSGCTVNAQFVNYTSGGTSFHWDFGDGTSSTQVSPTHYYNLPGSYDVTLIASNGTCADTLVMPGFINVNYVNPPYTPPSVPFSGCVGIASSFQSNNPNGVSYTWDFGDNSLYGTGSSPTHVYTAPGTYNVSLITLTTDSCQELISNFASIIVYGGDPTVNTANISCNAPYTVNFTTPSAGTAYMWTFGDGTTSNQQNPSHVYAADGFYNITLTVVSPGGCMNTYNGFNQLALFPFSAGVDASCNGIGGSLVNGSFAPIPADAASVQWTFSDGQTSNAIAPTMVFDTSVNSTIYATAVITNQYGCVDTVTTLICVDSPPAVPQPAGSGVPPDTSDTTPSAFHIDACAPYQLTFSNQFQYADNLIWHFGDGATSTDYNPIHEYESPGTYIVYTEVWYDNGNSYDTVYQPYVYNIGGYTPTITLTQQNFCDSIVVLFQGNSPDAVSWLWTLGNNDTETAQSFSYTYNSTQQTYNVQLTTIDSQGCPGMATSSVYSPITAPEFSYSTILCNMPLNITHNMDSAFTYLWDFGDNTTSTDMYPSHQYAGPGTYNLTLHITDGLGCPHDYVLDPVSLYMPTAHYTANVHSGCAPLTVNLMSNSTGYTAGNTHYWFWGNLGVTNNNGSQTTSYTFTQPGDYPVRLQVYNVNGQNCYSSFTDTIHVYGANANFGYTQNKSCFQPDIQVQYTDSSTNAVAWLWNFGDGVTSNLQNPTHTFTAMPNSAVNLTITDNHGCTDTISKPNISLFSASFTLNNNSVCGFSPINFDVTATGNYTTTWNFGDNNFASGNSVSHIYGVDGVYDAMAIVTSADGCVDSIVNQVTIVQPIAQFFSASPVTCAPSNVNFFNTSTAPLGSSYIWDFGDGTVITNNNPIVSQTYIHPGIYDVKLTVVSPQGCSADTTYTDYVTVLGPIAQFMVSNTNGCENLPIAYINQSTNAATWKWFFGDGNVDSTNFSLDHAFNQQGTYYSTLIVYDTAGCSNAMTMPTPIIINNMPHAAMVIDYPSGCAPYLPQYYNNSTEGTSYTWMFGNGDYSFDSIPSYTYQNPGSYTAMLIVGNGTGCQDTAVAFVTVNTPPIADFSVAITDTSCEGITIHFHNSSTADPMGADYKWAIDNGFNYAGFQPGDYMFDSSGVYVISLSVFNTYTGCYDTTSHSIIINVPGKPIGSLSTTDTLACGQITVNFDFWVQGADNMSVDYGDGIVTNAFNPQHTYTTPGTYTPQIILFNNFGCVDTLICNPITVAPVPVASFTTDTTFGCSGFTANFTNTSTVLNNPVYAWTFGNGQTSALASPLDIPYVNPGNYNVTLIVTNQFGCADTSANPNYITIADTLAPPVLQMRRVSVVSENAVKVVWEQSTVFDFGQYIVYRYDGTTYQPISTITDINQTEIIDNTGLVTLTNTYCYKVEVIDKCGYTSGIDSVTAHCTMDVTANLLQNNDRLLKWTPYGGCPVDYYEVYRTPANAWVDTSQTYLLATVSGTTTGYLDNEILCPRGFSYRIKAVSLCGGTLYSLSDTSFVEAPKLDVTTLPANVTRSTVVDNSFVRSEWKAPYAPQLISYFTIYRSSDSLSYQSIGQVNGPFTAADSLAQYDDWDASIQTKKYYYRVETTSQCNNKTSTGKTGDNIVLKAEIIPDQFQVELSWTPYVSWGPTGVDYYIIEWQDDAGVWHQLELPPGQYLNNQLPGNGPTSYSAPY